MATQRSCGGAETNAIASAYAPRLDFHGRTKKSCTAS